MVRTDGTSERHAVTSGIPLRAGDVIRIHTASGAGYGDPALRDPKLVRADVRDGLISEERAGEVYRGG